MDKLTTAKRPFRMGTQVSAPVAATAGGRDAFGGQDRDLVEVLRFHGDVGAGEQLPSVQEMAQELSSSPDAASRFLAFEAKLRALTEPLPAKVHNFSSFMSPEPSVAARPLSAVAARGFAFDLGDEQDRAAATAACRLSKHISRAKPLLVPSQLTETDFFKNYFTHVCKLRRWLFSTLHHGLYSAQPALVATGATGTLVVAGESFETRLPELSGSTFVTKEALAGFMAVHRHTGLETVDPTAPRTRALAPWSEAEALEKKRALMGLLRISEPSVLSLLLEETQQQLYNGALPDDFWARVQTRIVALSRRTETFTSVGTSISTSSAPPFVRGLQRAVDAFEYDTKRDFAAVRAAWDVDPGLAVAFRELIPCFVSKHLFWERFLRAAATEVLHELAGRCVACADDEPEPRPEQ